MQKVLLPPHHLVDDARIALDNLDDLGGDVLVYVVGHGDTVEAVLAKADGGVDCLKQAAPIDAGDDEAALVDGLGALRAGADAHGGEGVADAGEETALLGQRAAVAHYGEGVHLKAVVVVEAQGFLAYDAAVELETTRLESVAAAGVAAVENGHVVLLCHLVYGIEEGEEILLCVDVFFAVGREEDVFAFLQTKTLMNIAGFYFFEVLVEHLCHGRAGDVGALAGQAAFGEVAAGVLAVCQVHVGDNIDDAAVGLLGQALVFAAVARFHVEDGDVEALGADNAQAGVGVAEHEHSIGPRLREEFVGAVDDVAAGGTEVIAHSIHIYFGLCQLEVAEEDAVEVVVVVLPGVGEDDVEVAAALVDDGGKADNLGAGAHDDAKFQFAVVLPLYIGVVEFGLLGHNMLVV